MKVTKLYAAFRRIKNFTSVEIRPQSGLMLLYLRLDPDTVALEEGFTRDVMEDRSPGAPATWRL